MSLNLVYSFQNTRVERTDLMWIIFCLANLPLQVSSVVKWWRYGCHGGMVWQFFAICHRKFVKGGPLWRHHRPQWRFIRRNFGLPPLITLFSPKFETELEILMILSVNLCFLDFSASKSYLSVKIYEAFLCTLKHQTCITAMGDRVLCPYC